MGLGKTISCLAHMCATLEEADVFANSRDLKIRHGKNGNPIETVVPLQCAKTTLVVAPLSTISNWEEQLATHIKPGVLNTYIYHGSNREGDLDILANYDCIITTYSILSQEFTRFKKHIDDEDNSARVASSPLHHLKFFRVILVSFCLVLI
jgi:SNF2 family DNA or RNA helicase